MSSTSWYGALEGMMPYIFKIQTPDGSGTGFQISYSERSGLCGIATAWHVVKHEHEWEEPIKIIHHASGKSIVLKQDRVIIPYPEKDLAFILFSKGDLPIEQKPMSLIDQGKTLKQGVSVGWCGFPAVAINELCFFAGHVSCILKGEDSYLVDGVSIHGVSGGPAFYVQESSNTLRFFGVISAYRPNRATGEALPGLCVVRSVEPYQQMIKNLRDLDEAKQKEEEEKQKKEEDKQPVTAPSASKKKGSSKPKIKSTRKRLAKKQSKSR